MRTRIIKNKNKRNKRNIDNEKRIQEIKKLLKKNLHNDVLKKLDRELLRLRRELDDLHHQNYFDAINEQKVKVPIPKSYIKEKKEIREKTRKISDRDKIKYTEVQGGTAGSI